MIRFRFGVASPFRYEKFRNIWDRNWAVTKNKTLELQFYWFAYELISCDIDLAWRGEDHAGPSFELNILGWNFRIALEDNRHWDEERHCWEQTVWEKEYD
jgi:hypothetical protein